MINFKIKYCIGTWERPWGGGEENYAFSLERLLLASWGKPGKTHN